MLEMKFDFYSPSNVKINDLDPDLQNSLSVMNSLDYFTQNHCHNVANLTTRICGKLHMNNQFTLHCMIAGYIHDLGKLFVPQELIDKPGKLTDEEFEIVKTHTIKGYEYCLKDLYLRPYSDGPYYHHEALNGTGYPQGLTKNDIPYSAQIIRVADEYDALVTKRQYRTHVNISETLKELIKDAKPNQNLIALDTLRQDQRLGRIAAEPLKALFKVVADDTDFEIASIMDYIQYLESQIRRLKNIEEYEDKMKKAKKKKDKEYFKTGMEMLLQQGEEISTYKAIMKEYMHAIEIREERIKLLNNEKNIIKKLKI